MIFKSDKKERIILYLLEKIDQKEESLTRHVADEFGISQNVIYTYLKELEQEEIVKKIKRGTYTLVEKNEEYIFHRVKGEIADENEMFEKIVYDCVKAYGKNVLSIWNYAFSEMINNVIDHSDCDTLKVVVGHNYLNTWVVIQDDGVGIFDKIKKYFNLKSVGDAVSELFKGKLTTDAKNHSGEGIFFTSKMMDEFVIISSKKVFAINKYDADILLDFDNTKGTLLYMQLSNYSHKNTTEIFDMYADQEKGFTKTQIPIKNMFDADPVSRSQAKRVCNRLTDFKTVVFDFSEVTWVGQGFMDQIFRVFQNEHSDIELLPVNMCPEVEGMYKHVTSR